MRGEDGYDMEDMSRYAKSGVHVAWCGLEDLISRLLLTRSELVPDIFNNSNLTYTCNSLKFKLVIMISHIFSRLSASCSQLYYYLTIRSKIIRHYHYFPRS